MFISFAIIFWMRIIYNNFYFSWEFWVSKAMWGWNCMVLLTYICVCVCVCVCVYSIIKGEIRDNNYSETPFSFKNTLIN